MPNAAVPSPDERGTRWLQAQVEHMLAASAVTLAPRFEGDPACYWGTDRATNTTLYLRLAGDPEPKAIRFTSHMIERCGSGLYFMQSTAILFIRRELRKMGVLPT
jgi:hypothetical protein